jgi:hypothetical protein
VHPGPRHKLRVVWSAAAAFAAAAVLCASPGCRKHDRQDRPLPAVQTERLLVGAHYYIWYPRNLRQGYLRGSLTPPQTFAVGTYRLDDTAVLEKQIAWCSQYGIDFLTIDWWPGNDREIQKFFKALYGAPNLGDIRFCVFYETWGLGFNKDFGCTRFDSNMTARLLADFSTIADRCFSNPSYLRVGGRPVVVMYLARTFTGDFGDAIARLRQAMRSRGHDVFLVGDEVFWKVSPVGSGKPEHPLTEEPQVERIRVFDAITSYNMYEGGMTSHAGYASQSAYVGDVAAKYRQYIAAAGQAVYFAPQIIPGYNDRGTRLTVDHYAIPRQWTAASGEGSLFAELFDRHAFPFLDPRLNMMFITSWNEWNEDTGMEPLADTPATSADRSPSGRDYTQGYSYSGHGTRYLEVLMEKVVSISGRVCDLAGRGVRAVPVTAARAGSNAAHETRTDANGYYRFSRLTLPAGSYTVRAAGAARDVTVGATGCVCAVDFTMQAR